MTSPTHPASDGLPTIVALMGPTASGKTRLAIELAQHLDGEIISVDSAQVYRGMDIGTAKPDSEERQGIPHHLIDILDPRESYSTGRFRREALDLIADILARGKRPILAGGTQLYFNALLKGLSSLPSANPLIRQQIDSEAQVHGWAALHRQLAAIDPEAARRIHPNDPQRIQRALEVFRITGRPLTQLFKEDTGTPPLPFSTFKIVLTPERRESLHQRIEARLLNMFQLGFIEEVRALWNRNDLHADLPAVRAVGYRQIWDYLEGLHDLATLQERALIATRQFAKRQMTWLRRETDAIWLASETPHLTREALNLLTLKGSQQR